MYSTTSMYQCPCGSNIRRTSLAQHLCSDKHNKYLAKELGPRESNEMPVYLKNYFNERKLAVSKKSIQKRLLPPVIVNRPPPPPVIVNRPAPMPRFVNCVNCTALQVETNLMCFMCELSLYEIYVPVNQNTKPLNTDGPVGASEKYVETVVSSTWSECSICMDRRANVVLIPCGHMSICELDAIKLQETSKCCPICRQHFDMFQKVYV